MATEQTVNQTTVPCIGGNIKLSSPNIIIVVFPGKKYLLHDCQNRSAISRFFFVEIFPSVSLKRVPTEIVTSFVEFFSDSIDSAEKLANLAERERENNNYSFRRVFSKFDFSKKCKSVSRRRIVKIVIELETSSLRINRD